MGTYRGRAEYGGWRARARVQVPEARGSGRSMGRHLVAKGWAAEGEGRGAEGEGRHLGANTGRWRVRVRVSV